MYERLVRSVKLPLLKVVEKALLNFDELRTMLCKIEMAVNSRPLIYVSEDDLQNSLTPFHLIYGRDISGNLYVFIKNLIRVNFCRQIIQIVISM